LPRPREFDRFGGWTLPVYQWQWDHLCLKSTWLYIVGVRPLSIPPMPLRLGEPDHSVICSPRKRRRFRPLKKALSPAQRERTPRAFAIWLLDLASSTHLAPRRA